MSVTAKSCVLQTLSSMIGKTLYIVSILSGKGLLLWPLTTSTRLPPRQVFVMLCFMVELGRDDGIKLEVLLIPHSGRVKSFPLHRSFKKPLFG